MLPPGRYLPISSDAAAISMDVDGRSAVRRADLHFRLATARRSQACARPSRTRWSDFVPMRRLGPESIWSLRLAAHGRDFRIRICSGSGAETEVYLAEGVREIGGLVVRGRTGESGYRTSFRSIGATLDGDECSALPLELKGNSVFRSQTRCDRGVEDAQGAFGAGVRRHRRCTRRSRWNAGRPAGSNSAPCRRDGR